MLEYIIKDVKSVIARNGVELFYVIMEKPDGTDHIHVFPKMALTVRAAEYGIDPEDIDTILDVILHERFIPEPKPGFDDYEDPAASQGYTVAARKSRGAVRKGDQVPVSLFEADSTDQAREALLIRVDHCKKNVLNVVSRPQEDLRTKDPLDLIRNSYEPQYDVHAMYGEYVEYIRNEKLARAGEVATLRPTQSKKPEPARDFKSMYQLINERSLFREEGEIDAGNQHESSGAL